MGVTQSLLESKWLGPGVLKDGESIALAFHSLLKIKIVHARSVDIQGPASWLWK